MDTNIPATRSELLNIKAKIKLAIKGHRLLKQKRDALMREFMNLIQDYKKLKLIINEELKIGFKNLDITNAIDGIHKVKSKALASKKTIDIEYSHKNTMGVKIQHINIIETTIPQIETLGDTTIYIEESKKNFKEILKKIIKLSELEHNILTLAEEIKKTKRRVNSLEHIHIPNLENTAKLIKFRLSEVERDSFSMLKQVKKKIEEKQI